MASRSIGWMGLGYAICGRGPGDDGVGVCIGDEEDRGEMDGDGLA